MASAAAPSSRPGPAAAPRPSQTSSPRPAAGGPSRPPPSSRNSVTDPILRNTLRYTISAKEYATLHKYVLSRSRLLKRAAPSVNAVERIVDGDKASAAARQGANSGPGAAGKAVDDYNARAVRHSMRVFVGTALALKGWALISTKLLGGKPE